jgi:TetR/AcrR family transcriptional regulator, transcriptional repressor of bet genes
MCTLSNRSLHSVTAGYGQGGALRYCSYCERMFSRIPIRKWRMAVQRRAYRREGEERRREALIAAAIELVSEAGPAAATVRAIAERAGVTPGLIRHYFSGKEELTRTAYLALMGKMVTDNQNAVAAVSGNAATKLATCVVTWLRPPVMDPTALLVWAGFMPLIRSDQAMREAHGMTYRGFRDVLEGLIAALPGRAFASDNRALATACNAVVDGLWLEGSLQPEMLDQVELERIGLDAIGAILGLDLKGALPSEV